MPCRGPEDMYEAPSQEELRIRHERKVIEETQNLAKLLIIVKEALGESSEEGLEALTNFNDGSNIRPFDKMTKRLCKTIREATEEEKQLILKHPQGIFVATWSADHKVLDEKRK